MFRRSTARLATAFLVMLSLLFSQLALANYVCPAAAHERREMPAMQMAAGEPCESMDIAAGTAMDQQQPALCHQHCANAPQSFDPMQVPAVGLPAEGPVLVVPALLDADASESVVFARAGRARPPPDPIFLSTLRLRV